jgi:hypothetical protein
MFIAFEGPDKTGKSTSATNLAHDHIALYNATKNMHARQQEEVSLYPDYIPITYDRIDWLSHMVYRLAMPDREWYDDRPRTVFAMPDTHLVVKIHAAETVRGIKDELYDAGSPLAAVNDMYYYQTLFLIEMNKRTDYSLFRTISLVEVHSDIDNKVFAQRWLKLDSPIIDETEVDAAFYTDDYLMTVLREEERQRITV